MTHTLKNLSSLFIASMSVMAACQVAALDERWFRVELLIVSQGAAAAENSEAWDPTPTLAYPKKARFLFNPDKAASNLARLQATSDPMSPINATSNIDELGYQTITLSPVDETAEDANLIPAPPSGEIEVLDTPITPSPFTVLPHSELEFRGKAAYMARTGRYKTLFHESWLQRVATQENAIPIVIDHSGDDESWPALQGSVTFYLSRFLHLQTNLWLNTTGSYLPPQWSMPLAPLGPKSLIVIQPPEEETPSDPLLPLDSQEQPLTTEEALLEEQTQLELEQPLSPWRHAVVLNQERRMRSTEVHYLDHPLLGVIVKISPVTEKELLQRAEAEAKDNAAALTSP